jgi:hypothetical protein
LFQNSNNTKKHSILYENDGFESFRDLKTENTIKSKEFLNDLVIKTLLHFSSEKSFIELTQNKTNRTLKVLSKAAYHKMDDISPVTADQNRGNFYKRLSLFNKSKSINNSKFNNKNQISNLSHSLLLNKKSLNIVKHLKFKSKLN